MSTFSTEIRLVNAAGFPPDVPLGLRIRTSDGREWRVIRRESHTVLLLGAVYGRRDYVQLVFALLVGTLVGFALQWFLGAGS
jgi:hypothetical protein